MNLRGYASPAFSLRTAGASTIAAVLLVQNTGRHFLDVPSLEPRGRGENLPAAPTQRTTDGCHYRSVTSSARDNKKITHAKAEAKANGGD